MNKSRSNLALSCTFAMHGATLVQVEDPAAPALLDLGQQPNPVIDSKYKVLQLIGEGGMGSVYKVEHLHLQKEMALKTFRSKNLSPEVWERFQREAQAIGKLKHKNIVEVFDFGVSDGVQPYYTMSLLIGESLAERLERVGHLDLTEALTLFIEVADALAHAHRQGIVHRDIKPANIFLEQNAGSKGKTDQAKIVDFGIAKLSQQSSGNENQSLTQKGTVFGSPLYMSPEQARGDEVDQRSDIYSFGCSLFQTLAGEPPFTADTSLAVILRHLNDSPPQLRDLMGEARLPQRLDHAMARLLAKNVQKRYQNFTEVSNDLRFCLEGLDARRAPLAIPERGSDEAPSATAKQTADTAQTGQGADQAKLSATATKVLSGICVLALSAYLATQWFQPPMKTQHTQNLISPAPEQESHQRIAGGDSDPFSESRRSEEARSVPFFVRTGAKGEMIFEFPSYNQIGFLKTETKKIYCRGKVTIPQHRQLVFHATDECLKAPGLLRRFRRNDLTGLVLEQNSAGDWTADHFKYFENHLSQLIELGIRGPQFDDSVIAHLEKFPQLSILNIGETQINGRALACSKILSRVRVLRTTRDQMSLTPFFRAAGIKSNKCPLESLIVEDCKINDDDIKEIANIETLKVLMARANNVKGPGLIDLAQKSNLTILALDQNPIYPSYLKYFSKFKRLTSLKLDKTSFSEEQRKNLEDSMVLCKVEFVEQPKLEP